MRIAKIELENGVVIAVKDHHLPLQTVEREVCDAESAAAQVANDFILTAQQFAAGCKRVSVRVLVLCLVVGVHGTSLT